ncbi:MAG: MATE family efflux transporter [Coprobacter sp.]|nr:MATE family efflux transporter [Coprobacter sp.]
MNSFIRRYKSIYAALLKLGIPIIIGQLGIIIVGFADNIMVGHHSADELAAASFVNNLFLLSLMFGMGFSLGLTPLIGALTARNQFDEVGRSLRHSLWANFAVALFLMAVMWVVYGNIESLGQPEELLPLIKPYYLIQWSGLIFVMLFNAFKQFADGITDTRTSMYVLLAGNLLNIAGNYFLIFGKGGFPEWGLLGAGLSTLFSRIMVLLFFMAIFFFSSRYRCYKAGFLSRKVYDGNMSVLIKNGLPIAFQMGMETGAFSLSVIMMGWFGAAALAAHQVVTTFATIGFMLYYGIGAAITIEISRVKGEGRCKDIKPVGDAGFHLIGVMLLCCAVLIFMLRNYIGGWFTDSDEVCRIVVLLIIPTIVYQLGDGLQIAYSGALRGVGDMKPMAVIAFISYFLVCLPCGYLFGVICNGGPVGIWWGFPLGLTTAGVLFYLRFCRVVKKLIR